MDVFLLVFYVLLALGVSFLCSVAEAVLLSVSDGYIRLLEDKGRRSGHLLRGLTRDIDRPLAAILTLNTIAHTMGAAGAGAQAATVFGSGAVGVFSALLTLLILVLSEIIPKTLGAYHWRRLAPGMAYVLRVLIAALLPFVRLSEALTRWPTGGQAREGINRDELAALADYRRELTAVPEGVSALRALEQAITRRSHMLLVVDEYGSTEGIVTLEDLMETVLGEEIVDEGDMAVDLRAEARRLGRRRARHLLGSAGVPGASRQ